MKAKKILVLLNVQGRFYLKTREECAEKTLQNAIAGGYSVVSRNDKGITEALTETAYGTAIEARVAARRIGIETRTYQWLARYSKNN